MIEENKPKNKILLYFILILTMVGLFIVLQKCSGILKLTMSP